MKKNITYVERAKFEELIAASGVPTQEKAGWTLVGPHGTKGPRLYVPKTKRVGRVDAVGLSGAGLTDLGEDKTGSVTHQLDMSGDEAAILAAFARLLDGLATAQPNAPAQRAPRKAKGTETGGEVAAAPARKDRKSLIKERAAAISADEA